MSYTFDGTIHQHVVGIEVRVTYAGIVEAADAVPHFAPGDAALPRRRERSARRWRPGCGG